MFTEVLGARQTFNLHFLHALSRPAFYHWWDLELSATWTGSHYMGIAATQDSDAKWIADDDQRVGHVNLVGLVDTP
jgi:hypothetical protein